ncbi:unnamed protein product [Strongylus vulgaris]|uniref:Uncharacterized protein n=1 Tax=Strongylus vulgaris TaxID=40348 RepID=A0A3P7LUE3_STRVU|nr:unnamed protein product [Strongylus vulgaris]
MASVQPLLACFGLGGNGAAAPTVVCCPVAAPSCAPAVPACPSGGG